MISSADVKLGFRMLRKYPGLTIAGGLALAIAIGVGAGWYDFSQDLLHPRIPLPDGDRLVVIDVRDSLGSRLEQRLLSDFVGWRRDAKSVEQLSAYRSIERTVAHEGARIESALVAETTASALRVARVPPLLGRTLLDADEQRDAPPVVLLGYQAWLRLFAGQDDAIGQTIDVGTTSATVVGVMPQGFAFPINHQLWVPLQLRPSGYAPLEGVQVRVFGLLASGATRPEATAELDALVTRIAATSPQTHANLSANVRPYGGRSPGGTAIELALTHVPILLVLVIACITVGILIYARIATRDAEIAMRYALGANRTRILRQLFAEALVLTSAAGLVGLIAAHAALRWGKAFAASGQAAGPPFWMESGLRLSTVFYAMGLAVVAAAILGVMPALKATGARMQSQLQNLGSGGSTLRFGRLWATAMIMQVALTVVVIPPAIGIATEGVRDRVIRARFPVEDYIAVRLELDRDAGRDEESDAAFAARREQTYAELERRISQEPGVSGVTFGDRLPGMDVAVRRAEVEITPGAAPQPTNEMWTSIIGPGFFETFDRPIIAGRTFTASDRSEGSRTVIVNEAFARRRFMQGANPIGRRVRYIAGDGTRGEWLEIVGIVRDFGMTPTDLGEAPYIFHAASAGTVAPLVMGVRIAGDRAAVVRRVRAAAGEVDRGLRIAELQTLDDLAWDAEIESMTAAGSVSGIVLLGLFLSACGIYSLVSVSVARRTREIGLRTALGASRRQVLVSIVSKAAWLVGSGLAAGNAVILLVLAFTVQRLPLVFITRALVVTSAIMLTVGLLACLAPARRALRIHPTDALRHL
jgi:putative ABC transport system permease protein